MLLDITGQLKHIIRAIEAIPLHLTLDIVRLDDAHGESWALPLQACTTWEVSSSYVGVSLERKTVNSAAVLQRHAPIRSLCQQQTRSRLYYSQLIRRVEC
jgi:hypothetical protein